MKCAGLLNLVLNVTLACGSARRPCGEGTRLTSTKRQRARVESARGRTLSLHSSLAEGGKRIASGEERRVFSDMT